MSKTFWAPLLTPGIDPECVNALMKVAEYSSAYGIARIEFGSNITDQARNLIVAGFIEHSKTPADTLVMLDCDHIYPPDIVARLAKHDRPVVGALYFGRREPYEVMCFQRRAGKLERPHKWTKPGMEVAVVGTAAIAIRRDVFDRLQAAGFEYPWFRYTYVDKGRHRPSEDMYFGECCEKAGIAHYVDTTISIPHMQPIGITEEAYQAFHQNGSAKVRA